jgi:hypothetical protein
LNIFFYFTRITTYNWYQIRVYYPLLMICGFVHISMIKISLNMYQLIVTQLDQLSLPDNITFKSIFLYIIIFLYIQINLYNFKGLTKKSQ